MNVDEYLWRNKETLKAFANAIDVTCASATRYKQQKSTPNLLIALKIMHVCKNEVPIMELLSLEDQEKYKKFLDTYNNLDV